MIDNTTDWTKLREFRGVSLTSSFVLSWEVDGCTLLVDLDLCLSREHPFYDQPRPSQKGCIRAALLEFPDCTAVLPGVAQAGHGVLGEAVRTLGAGSISGFRRSGEGRYELKGGFGTVEILSGRPMLRFKDIT